MTADHGRSRWSSPPTALAVTAAAGRDPNHGRRPPTDALSRHPICRKEKKRPPNSMAPWLRAVPCRTRPKTPSCMLLLSIRSMLCCRPTDRILCTHTKRKQKQTNKKRGWERERNPYGAVPSPPPPVRQKQKKKRELSKMPNGLSHDNALPIGNPTLLGLLGLLGFFGLLLRPESPLAPAPTLALGL